MRQTNFPAVLRGLPFPIAMALVSISGEMLATAEYFDRHPDEATPSRVADTFAYFIWRMREVADGADRDLGGSGPTPPEIQGKDSAL